jgi:helicase required for RNAi-mediated heterochromatin assembly 1
VHICEVIPSTRGLAVRVTFSLFRIGKKVVWEQSKRLTTGSLVVLTPANDMFKKKTVVATVAARPLSALEQDPPEVDLFIARAEELEIDPAVEWVMVEDRRSLYEAHRHTMLALQKMMREEYVSARAVVSRTSPRSDSKLENVLTTPASPDSR